MPGRKKEKKAKSKSQQRLFGMVTAYKAGKLELDKLPASLAKKVKETADGSKRKTGDKRKKTKGITMKAASELASTKHKGLPENVKENKTLKFEEYLNEGKTINQTPKEIADEVYAILINAQVGNKPVKEKWLINTLKGFGYDKESDNGKLFDNVASELVSKGMDIELDESLVKESSEEYLNEGRTNFTNKKCATCGKELTNDDNVIIYNKDLIHANTDCIWDYSKEKNIRMKNKTALPLKDAIKVLKKREGKRTKTFESNKDEELKSTGSMVIQKPEGYMDALKGGEAQGKTIEDIADMHNIPVEYLKKIMPSAIEIELEHTDDPEIAARIALDHLAETPIYYDDKIGLPEMEKELEDIDDDEIIDIINKKIRKFQDIDDDVDDEDEEIEESVNNDIEGKTEQEKIIDKKIKNLVKKFNDYKEEAEEESGEEAEEENIVDNIQETHEEEKEEGDKKISIRYFENFNDDVILPKEIKESTSLFQSLSDYVNEPGDTEIWYEKEINFDGWDFREQIYDEDSGYRDEYIKKKGERIDPNNLEKTHSLLGKIKETDLDKIYNMLNSWGNGDETNQFLKDKGVHHTSMSIGDIIKIDDKVFFVDENGFKDITNE